MRRRILLLSRAVLGVHRLSLLAVAIVGLLGCLLSLSLLLSLFGLLVVADGSTLGLLGPPPLLLTRQRVNGVAASLAGGWQRGSWHGPRGKGPLHLGPFDGPR